MNRKFGRRGGRGRGAFREDGGRQTKKGYLPEELMSHYRRVQESLAQFEDEEKAAHLDHSKHEFLNNVVSSLSEELIQVSQNQTVSTIIETIIASASVANLRTLYVSAVANLSISFLDRFASHVLEALVLRLPEFFDPPTQISSEDEEDEVAQNKVVESFESMCEFVDAQFELLVTHMYGSHVLQAFLEALSGVYVAQELKKRQKSGRESRSWKESPQQMPKRKPPGTFKALFEKYSKRLFRVCDYEVHLKDPLFSRLLQAVLMILHQVEPDLCQKHCQTILQRVADSCPQAEESIESIPDMARDPAGSHLLEVIFKLSSEDVRRHTFDSLLKGRLLLYAIHPAANHVLQAFMASLHDKDLMEKIFEELSKHLEDILAVGYFGLVVSLAEGCRRFCVKQEDFLMILMEAFHCREPQERQRSLMKLITSFTTYEVFFCLEEGKDKPDEGAQEVTLKDAVNLHGSRLIQELLQFQKPTHAALGLLDFQPAELQLLCCDPAGSHVVDVYFSSPKVIEKNRDIFLRKLKGLLVEVACNKNGSRCLENVWKNLNLTQRTALAKELSESERLHGDRFGHFLHHSFQLPLFTTNRKRWQEQQGALTKRKKMMRELLHKSVSESPAKKRKREEHNSSEQKEDHIEDTVTAMFIKQKKHHDMNLLASAHHGVNPEETEPPTHKSSDFPRAEGSPGSKKKKKKKDKVKPDSASPIRLPDFNEDELGFTAEKRKKVKTPAKQQGETEFQEKVKKKKKKKDKVKPDSASPIRSPDTNELGFTVEKRKKVKTPEKQQGETEFQEKVKKKKKSEKLKMGEDE